MTPSSAVGPRIKRARERLKLTQRQLAKIVDVDVKTVDNWEHDRTYPKNRLGALEDALGIDLHAPATDQSAPETDPDEIRIMALESFSLQEKEMLIALLHARRAAAARAERKSS